MSDDTLPPAPAPAPAPAVPEPASWQLIEYLRDRVGLITTANGCYTDIGTGTIVIDDAQADINDTQADVLVVLTQLDITSSSPAQMSSDATVVIEVALPLHDETNPRLLSHRVAADLRRVLFHKERDLPRFIRTLQLTSFSLVDVVDTQGAGSIVVQATARAGLTDTAPPAIQSTP